MDGVPGLRPDPEPTRSGAEGLEPLKPLACGFSLDSMGRRGHDWVPGRPRHFRIVLVEADSCAGAWNGFQQVQLISDEWRGGHWETKGWRAARCHMAGEGHGEILILGERGSQIHLVDSALPFRSLLATVTKCSSCYSHPTQSHFGSY